MSSSLAIGAVAVLALAAHGARRGSSAKPWVSGHGQARRRKQGPSEPVFTFDSIGGKDAPTAWILESETRPAVIGHLQVSRVRQPLAEDGELNEDCQQDVKNLRRELDDKSAPVFLAWRSGIKKEYRSLGYGTRLYLFALEMLKQQEGRDVILIPEACAMDGSTSDQAGRVWSALQSRMVSHGEATTSRLKSIQT
jgi:GNAT superfamily N-acetyltransferase